MPNCSVLICKNRGTTSNLKTNGVSYHRFPKDPEIKNKWITATGRENNWFPSNLSVVCSSHFQEDCFDSSAKKRMLFEWAVPTLKLRYIFETPASQQESIIAKTESSTTLMPHYLQSASQQEFITVKTEPSTTPMPHYLQSASQQEFITVKTEPSTTPMPQYLQSASQQEFITVKTEPSTTPMPHYLKSASQQEFITVKTEPSTTLMPHYLQSASTTPVPHYLQSASQQEFVFVKTEPSTTPMPHYLQSASQQESITVKTKSLTTPIPCSFTDDIASNLADTTQKLKRLIQKKDNVIKKQKLHIKRLQTTVRRYKKKVKDMKEIFSALKEKKFVNEDQVLELENMDVSTRDLIIRYNTSLAAGHVGKAKYSPGLKSFATTLHLYSPKAYEFVRQKFVTCLPHVRTIKKWNAADAKPGFTTESLKEEEDLQNKS